MYFLSNPISYPSLYCVFWNISNLQTNWMENLYSSCPLPFCPMTLWGPPQKKITFLGFIKANHKGWDWSSKLKVKGLICRHDTSRNSEQSVERSPHALTQRTQRQQQQQLGDLMAKAVSWNRNVYCSTYLTSNPPSSLDTPQTEQLYSSALLKSDILNSTLWIKKKFQQQEQYLTLKMAWSTK